MIPSSLALPSPPSVAMETALAFQNAERITGALRTNSGGGWNGYAQSVIYWLVQPGDIVHVKAASEVYEAVRPSAVNLIIARANLHPGSGRTDFICGSKIIAQGRPRRKTNSLTHREVQSAR